MSDDNDVGEDMTLVGPGKVSDAVKMVTNH
jgi:hypothetical protein